MKPLQTPLNKAPGPTKWVTNKLANFQPEKCDLDQRIFHAKNDSNSPDFEGLILNFFFPNCQNFYDKFQ
jgi:hypothetical protein